MNNPFYLLSVKLGRGRYTRAHGIYQTKEDIAVGHLSYVNCLYRKYPQDVYRYFLGAYLNHWRYVINPTGIYDANTMIKLSL